jgi:hypothetical protein
MKEYLKVIGMFEHITHYNKNMEKMMIGMLALKLQQHEVEKLELTERCQYAIHKMGGCKVGWLTFCFTI